MFRIVSNFFTLGFTFSDREPSRFVKILLNYRVLVFFISTRNPFRFFRIFFDFLFLTFFILDKTRVTFLRIFANYFKILLKYRVIVFFISTRNPFRFFRIFFDFLFLTFFILDKTRVTFLRIFANYFKILLKYRVIVFFISTRNPFRFFRIFFDFLFLTFFILDKTRVTFLRIFANYFVPAFPLFDTKFLQFYTSMQQCSILGRLNFFFTVFLVNSPFFGTSENYFNVVFVRLLSFPPTRTILFRTFIATRSFPRITGFPRRKRRLKLQRRVPFRIGHGVLHGKLQTTYYSCPSPFSRLRIFRGIFGKFLRINISSRFDISRIPRDFLVPRFTHEPETWCVVGERAHSFAGFLRFSKTREVFSRRASVTSQTRNPRNFHRTFEVGIVARAVAQAELKIRSLRFARHFRCCAGYRTRGNFGFSK